MKLFSFLNKNEAKAPRFPANELLEAADQLKVWVERNKAIFTIGHMLERLGSLSKAEDEADAARVIAEARLKVAQASVAAIEQQNADNLQAAYDQAAKIVGDAEGFAAAARQHAVTAEAELAESRQAKATLDAEILTVRQRHFEATAELHKIHERILVARGQAKQAGVD